LQPSSTVIITGGSSGIGRAIAERFASVKSQVFIIGRNQETLHTTAQALGAYVTWRQADVSKRDQVTTTVTFIADQCRRIDVLVNAAGFIRRVSTNTPLDEAEHLWDEILDTNLKGSFLMTMAVAPYLSRPGGRVINISSMAAFTGGSRPGTMAYAAAKAGLHGLTYSLARELSPQGITVNAVAPGFIADTGSTNDWTEERIQSTSAQTPVGRMGNVNDIADAVLYLASPEASFITGEVLNVNGGLLFGR
jgi:3-oxoacyl-[acyl-carrier protein] reductase